MQQYFYLGYLSAAVIGFGSALPALAADTRFSLGAGVEYTNGTYGSSQSTHVVYAPVTAKLENGVHTAKLILPYLVVSTPAGGDIIAIDDSGRSIRDGDGRLVTESGLGDIVASYGYNLLDSRASGTIVDMVAKIKFGTADATRGLGTGENDYALQLDGLKTLARFTTLGTLGYKVLGDPVGVNFDNVWFSAVGGAYRYSAQGSIGLIYDYRQAATAAADAQREFTAYLGTKTDSGNRFQVYVLAGLSDSSPDWGAGLVFTSTF